jgi:acid phosphatase
MAVFRSISLTSATVILAQLNSVRATTFLSPEQDILLPASSSASEPLEWAGANSPYFAGEMPYSLLSGIS